MGHDTETEREAAPTKTSVKPTSLEKNSVNTFNGLTINRLPLIIYKRQEGFSCPDSLDGYPGRKGIEGSDPPSRNTWEFGLTRGDEGVDIHVTTTVDVTSLDAVSHGSQRLSRVLCPP